MEDGLHVGVGQVEGLLVEVQVVLVVGAHVALVEDAQHLVQAVVHLAVQTRYLNDDAVVVQAVHEPVGNAAHDGPAVVVEGLMAHVDHRLLNLSHAVPQQVDGHHRQRVAVGAVGNDVLRVLVVHAQVLPEAQRLSGQPRLLQLNEDELLLAAGVPDGGAEVDAEDGQRLLLPVGVLVGAHLHFHYLLLQQRRQDGARDALVFHEILEHRVVDGVGNGHHSSSLYF